MELTTVKVKVSRKNLKAGGDKAKRGPFEGRINLPVEDVILGILHRLITEERGQQDGSEKSGGICEVFERQPEAGEP